MNANYRQSLLKYDDPKLWSRLEQVTAEFPNDSDARDIAFKKVIWITCGFCTEFQPKNYDCPNCPAKEAQICSWSILEIPATSPLKDLYCAYLDNQMGKFENARLKIVAWIKTQESKFLEVKE